MIDFDHYRTKDLPELSADDRQKPYASYYERGRLTPNADLLAAVSPQNPMDPRDAYRLDQVKDLIQPDCPAPVVGYCALPGGGAYACTVVEMPGVNMNMVNWWIPWVLSDHMRYKIWHPGSHLEHYEGLAVEDIGGGMADIFMDESYSNSDFGFAAEPSTVNPEILSLNSCKGQIRLHSEPVNSRKGQFSMIHLVKKTSSGIVYWSMAWVGLILDQGRVVNAIQPDETVTAENGRHFASHLAHEYTTFAKILPELYAQYKDDPIKKPEPWPDRLKDRVSPFKQ